MRGLDPRRTFAAWLLAAVMVGCGTAGAPPEVVLEPLPAGPPLFTLALVGDTHGHDLVMDADDPDPLADVRHLLASEDAFFFNHEGVLGDQPPAPGTCRSFPNQSQLDCHPHAADFLAPAAVNAAALANNHVLDCGGEGIQRTIQELRARGIETSGAGADPDEACAPVLLDVNGHAVGLLSYVAIDPDYVGVGPTTPGAATWDACGGPQRVADLAATGAFVVVSLHLHLTPSWTDRTSNAHRAFVEEVLDAGAHLVFAHGSHVPQGILVRDGRLAFLSLGNFCFEPGHLMPDAAHDSVVAKVAVYATHLGVTLVPLRLDAGGRPVFPSEATGRRILERIASLSGGFGTPVAVDEGVARAVVVR
jgi:poly-gamma-glutamate synthesis protein (capsule biosynthesis protein)